jgi:hypothetical protein
MNASIYQKKKISELCNELSPKKLRRKCFDFRKINMPIKIRLLNIFIKLIARCKCT